MVNKRQTPRRRGPAVYDLPLIARDRGLQASAGSDQTPVNSAWRPNGVYS